MLLIIPYWTRSKCCCCSNKAKDKPPYQTPIICKVPKTDHKPKFSKIGEDDNEKESSEIRDIDFVKKNLKLPPRASYLNPNKRPLISHPMNDENTHFNLDKKYKINQQILDGLMDSKYAISAPSVFPYAADSKEEKKKKKNEEIIYILQLPDLVKECPEHKKEIRTPRFLWHTCKCKDEVKETTAVRKDYDPKNKPKPWLISRHTDFDLMSQWPLENPAFETFKVAAPIILNAAGTRYATKVPAGLDEDRLRQVVNYMCNQIASETLPKEKRAGCCCCAKDKEETQSDAMPRYVPVVVVPVQSADECPFDLEEVIKKCTSKDVKEASKKASKKTDIGDRSKKEEPRKVKKKPFVMQRFTDFDLLSQW